MVIEVVSHPDGGVRKADAIEEEVKNLTPESLLGDTQGRTSEMWSPTEKNRVAQPEVAQAR